MRGRILYAPLDLGRAGAFPGDGSPRSYGALGPDGGPSVKPEVQGSVVARSGKAGHLDKFAGNDVVCRLRREEVTPSVVPSQNRGNLDNAGAFLIVAGMALPGQKNRARSDSRICVHELATGSNIQVLETVGAVASIFLDVHLPSSPTVMLSNFRAIWPSVPISVPCPSPWQSSRCCN